MTKRVFIDTSWNSKPHICYDPEKDVFFEVDDLRELPEGYDEIYVDSSIFPNMWEQLKPLIYDGRRVFYFARPWKWREIRQRFREDLKSKTGRVSKSDRGDAFLLWKVYELSLIKKNTHRYFKEINNVDVELRPLLMKENILYKTLQKLQAMKEVGVDVLNEIKEYEEKLKNIRMEIVEKAFNVIPRFNEIAEGLGLGKEDISGLTGLTALLVYLKLRSVNKCINYMKLFKAKGKDGKKKLKCNRKLARYCNILTHSILWRNNQYGIARLKDMRMTVKKLVSLLRETESAMTGEGG